MTKTTTDQRTRHRTHVITDHISSGLHELGVRPGDVVMLHSALSSFGYVEGGADAVIDGILETVGAEGTLVVPSFPSTGWMYDSIKSYPLFDMRTVPTKAGRVAETVRLRPDSLRSLEPWGAVAAIGKHAAYVTRDEPESDDCCGALSPWGKLVELNAQIVLAGVGLGSCTLMHTLESLADTPYGLTRRRLPWRVVNFEGQEITRSQRSHSKGVPRAYTLIEPVLLECGVLEIGAIGDSGVRVVRARDLIDIGLQLLAQDPYFLLTVDQWQPSEESD